uniref:PITH domain-containing protein n=1 Tax=Strigamia maritima TaxID=126957 RepID=T1J4J0_STRMM
MPTFIFYRNKIKIDRLTGADLTSLEAKIVQLLGTDEGGDSDVGVVGHMDLITFITKSECECLNESDDHGFADCLNDDGRYLESDCDEQMIMFISFNRAIKLHSLRIKGPEENGPKTLKIFINQPKTLDFDQAIKMEPTQQVELSKKDLLEGNIVPLRFVKFQNVQNLQVFFKDNQNGSDVTRIDHLCFIGSPLSTTNMGDFKRVAGKKGESH